MDDDIFILYSITSQGWLTAAANYSSDWKEAKLFTYNEAQTIARKHKTDAGYKMIIVWRDDMAAL